LTLEFGGRHLNRATGAQAQQQHGGRWDLELLKIYRADNKFAVQHNEFAGTSEKRSSEMMVPARAQISLLLQSSFAGIQSCANQRGSMGKEKE
jgi:hypothetical protein